MFYTECLVPGPSRQTPRIGTSIEARLRSLEEPEPRNGNFFHFLPNSERLTLFVDVLEYS